VKVNTGSGSTIHSRDQEKVRRNGKSQVIRWKRSSWRMKGRSELKQSGKEPESEENGTKPRHTSSLNGGSKDKNSRKRRRTGKVLLKKNDPIAQERGRWRAIRYRTVSGKNEENQDRGAALVWGESSRKHTKGGQRRKEAAKKTAFCGKKEKRGVPIFWN